MQQNSSSSSTALDEIAGLLASIGPEKILTFKFSSALQTRMAGLAQRKKEGLLRPDELADLERYMAYDFLISLAKARAIRTLSTQKQAPRLRKAGWGRAIFRYVAPDFDETPPGFEEYMPS